MSPLAVSPFWFSLSISLYPLPPIFSHSPHGLLFSFSSSFDSSNPPCHPIYKYFSVNIGTEKSPKVTLWQANQALVPWHHSHPSGTLIWFQRPFAFHLWLSKVINLPCFPRRCCLTTESQPCKRKEQQRKWAMAFWSDGCEQMIWTGNIQCLKCTLYIWVNSVYLAKHFFFTPWQRCRLIASCAHRQHFFALIFVLTYFLVLILTPYFVLALHTAI